MYGSGKHPYGKGNMYTIVARSCLRVPDGKVSAILLVRDFSNRLQQIFVVRYNDTGRVYKQN